MGLIDKGGGASLKFIHQRSGFLSSIDRISDARVPVIYRGIIMFLAAVECPKTVAFILQA